MSDLNNNLNPVDSPFTQSGSVVTPYEFGAVNERNAVGNFNLKNFTFNKGTGGTLTLGGTSNGNGQLLIKNDSGATIVEGNNNGLTITNGSITIKNSGGTLSYDGSGVVSSSNFQGVSVTSSGTYTTSGTSFVDVPNSGLTTLILTRTTRVLLFAFVYGWNNGWLYAPDFNTENEVIMKDTNSGTGYINNFFAGNVTTDISNYPTSVNNVQIPETIYRQGIRTLSAGTYDFKLQFATGGAGTATIFNFEAGYIVLGT